MFFVTINKIIYMELKIKKFSVVIVGAGPAGSSAAKILSKAGISVAIIDKKEFPREKLCGGLLTGRSKLIFDSIFSEENWEKIVNYTSNGCDFYHGFEKINDVENYSTIYFTNRYDFDNNLLNSAISSGTKSYLKRNVVNIDTINMQVVLQNNERLKYNFLIGADGVHSIVAKNIFGKFNNQKNVALGLEVDIEISKLKNFKITKPEIFFGLVEWGYAWVFPKKGKLTVGLAGLLSKNKNLNKIALKNFIKKRFDTLIDEKNIKGHFIPFGNFKKIPGKENILLCGDSAGLVEPITGEGIAFAMESGKMCAESIIEAIDLKSTNALKIYLKKYKKLTNIFLWSKILRNIIFNPRLEGLFLKILKKSNSLPKHYLDLLEGKITYFQLIKKSIINKIKKFFLYWKKYD